MAMASVGHADTTGEIKKLASIIGVDIGAFGAVGNKVKDATPDRGHMLEIFGVEGVCGHDFFPVVRYP
jgi:hypothetical protein